MKHSKYRALDNLQPINEPAKAGQLAAKKVTFDHGRYAVAPVHTRFHAVQWFVWDAELNDNGNPAVVRQAPTFAAAVDGLVKVRKNPAKPKAANATQLCANPLLMEIGNPSCSLAARQAYEEFHGEPPERMRPIEGEQDLVALGELVEVVYRPRSGARRGPEYFHRFGKGAVLAATADGKTLQLIPGKKPFRIDWSHGIIG